MDQAQLEAFIYARMSELDQKLDEKEYIAKGRFVFGFTAAGYAHLPSWEALKKGRKKLIRRIWLNGFLIALVSVGITLNESSGRPVWKSFTASVPFALLCAVVVLYSLMIEANKVHRIARRLVYEDLLYQVQHKREPEKMPA